MNIHILRGQIIKVLQSHPPAKGSEYMEIVWKNKKIKIPVTDDDELNNLLKSVDIQEKEAPSTRLITKVQEFISQQLKNRKIESTQTLNKTQSVYDTELIPNSTPQKNTATPEPHSHWRRFLGNITSIGTQIGHIQAKDIPKGVCEGLVLSWAQSVLADDQGTFDKRIEILTTDPKEGWLFWGKRYHNLGDAIRDARNVAQSTKQPLSKLNEDTQHLLEIPAFLDTMYLYYAPSMTELKETLPIQSTQAISPYALPKALASSSDESSHLSSQYTIHNLDHFTLVELLLSLCEDVSSTPNQQQVFKINSSDHTIALSIQDGKITLFDQNYLNTGNSIHTEFEEDEIDSLASEILSRFHQTKNNKNLLCALERISLQRTENNTESVTDQDIDYETLAPEQRDTLISLNLRQAIRNGNVIAVSHIFNEHNIQPTPELIDLFFLACKSGQSDIINIFLNNGFDLLMEGGNGITPLHIFTLYNHKKMIDQIGRSQPELFNLKTRNTQTTPFHIAVMNGHSKTVAHLIEKGANPNLRNRFGSTPVEMATHTNNPEIALILLRNKKTRVDSKSMISIKKTINKKINELKLKIKEENKKMPSGTKNGHEHLEFMKEKYQQVLSVLSSEVTIHSSIPRKTPKRT